MRRSDAGFLTALASMLASGRTGYRPRMRPTLPEWYRTASGAKRGGPYNRDQERERRRRQIECGALNPNCRRT